MRICHGLLTVFFLSLSTLAPAQSTTPKSTTAQLDPPWKRLGLHNSIEWILDPEIFIDSRSPKRNLAEEVDRASMLDKAVATAKADHKLVMWYVYRIVEDKLKGRQMYRAPVLDLYAMQVLFNDTDVCKQVSSNYVPIRMVCDETLAARFDLRPLEFVEPAIVFLNGQGEVVHVVERLRTFDANWFAALLGRVTEKFAAADSPKTRGASEATAARVDRTTAAKTDPGHALKLAYRDALETTAPTPAPEWRTRMAHAMHRVGRTPQAIQQLQSVWDSGASDRRMEAGYYLGAYAAALGRHEDAAEWFETVAAANPQSLFAARARANLASGQDDRPYGATFAGFEHLGTLPKEAFEGLPRDTRWPAHAARTRDQIAERAIDVLLGLQREDGAFADSRYAYWPNPEITPNAWVAITSIAAAALHVHRDRDPRIEDAVQRAEAFAFDPKNLRRGVNEDVYADTFRLAYLAERHVDASETEQPALVHRMNRILEEAATRQRDSGFFAHEYPNAFCTAAMMWSAYRAREAGATVPTDMISRGLTALVSARSENGAYSYSGAAQSRGRRGSTLKDASTRMPVCEATLFAFGQSDQEKVHFALDNFWQHIDRIEGVRRNDFHSDGELGGFFFFHALYHTTEITRIADEDHANAHRTKTLELLQQIGEMDGSFLDSHEIGKAYGTAMALLTLSKI